MVGNLQMPMVSRCKGQFSRGKWVSLPLRRYQGFYITSGSGLQVLRIARGAPLILDPSMPPHNN